MVGLLYHNQGELDLAILLHSLHQRIGDHWSVTLLSPGIALNFGAGGGLGSG